MFCVKKKSIWRDRINLMRIVLSSLFQQMERVKWIFREHICIRFDYIQRKKSQEKLSCISIKLTMYIWLFFFSAVDRPSECSETDKNLEQPQIPSAISTNQSNDATEDIRSVEVPILGEVNFSDWTLDFKKEKKIIRKGQIGKKEKFPKQMGPSSLYSDMECTFFIQIGASNSAFLFLMCLGSIKCNPPKKCWWVNNRIWQCWIKIVKCSNRVICKMLKFVS